MNGENVLPVLKTRGKGRDIDGFEVVTFVDTRGGGAVPGGISRSVARGNFDAVEVGVEAIVVADGKCQRRNC